MVGLILIAFGTGGIKPCVSAFGGDQFDEDNVSGLRPQPLLFRDEPTSTSFWLPAQREAEVLLHLLHVNQCWEPPVDCHNSHPEK